MNPQEILPTPEVDASSETFDTSHELTEAGATKALEQGSSSKGPGAGAMNAAAIDDAQGQLQGILQGDDTGIVATSAVVDVPDDADDIDVIEKIWVEKAKDIVRATEGDPYMQNKELNKMKVAYVKKRFGKELKLKEV